MCQMFEIQYDQEMGCVDKPSSGGIFDTPETWSAHINSQADLRGLCFHRAAVAVMRKFHVALTTTHCNNSDKKHFTHHY